GQSHAAGEVRAQPCGDLLRKPALASTTRTCERHETGAGDEGLELYNLLIPADETGQMERQVVRRRAKRLERHGRKGIALKNVWSPGFFRRPSCRRSPGRTRHPDSLIDG